MTHRICHVVVVKVSDVRSQRKLRRTFDSVTRPPVGGGGGGNCFKGLWADFQTHSFSSDFRKF